jgi:hypothetical protein
MAFVLVRKSGTEKRDHFSHRLNALAREMFSLKKTSVAPAISPDSPRMATITSDAEPWREVPDK